MATDPQESIRECIIENVVTTLRAVKKGDVPVGGSSGYNYTPDHALRVSGFRPNLLDTNLGSTMWFVTTGIERLQERTTNKQFRSELEILALGCRLIKAVSEDPFRRQKNKEHEDQVRNRLLKDGQRALTEDFTRGRKLFPDPVGNRSLASNTELGPVRIDQGQFLPFVCVELAMVIEYDFLGMEP